MGPMSPQKKGVSCAVPKGRQDHAKGSPSATTGSSCPQEQTPVEVGIDRMPTMHIKGEPGCSLSAPTLHWGGSSQETCPADSQTMHSPAAMDVSASVPQERQPKISYLFKSTPLFSFAATLKPACVLDAVAPSSAVLHARGAHGLHMEKTPGGATGIWQPRRLTGT